MPLTPEAIKEFQAIIREEYGKELSEGEAGVLAKRLLLLYELIYRPLPGERAKQLSSQSPTDDPSQAAS